MSLFSSLRWIFGRKARSRVARPSPCAVLGVELLGGGLVSRPICRHVVPTVEALEIRIVPTAQMAYTNATTDGMWSTAANWTNILSSSDHHVPTSADYALLSPNSNLYSVDAICFVNTNETVDRVEMDAGYTHLLTITGATLTTNNYIQQYGPMQITNGGTVHTHDFMTVNGSVAVVAGGSLIVDATLYLEYSSGLGASSGRVIASAYDIYGPISADSDASHVTANAVVSNASGAFEVQNGAELSIDAVFSSYEGDLLVDSGGAMEIDEDFSQLAGTIALANAGALSFYSADPPSFAGPST